MAGNNKVKKAPERIVRSAYTPRQRVYTDIGGPSLTEQSFKKECDVNHILKSFGAVKVSPAYQAKLAAAHYGYAPAESFHEAVNISLEAADLFGALPATLRKRFNNHPGELLAFVEDAENYQEASELGLVPMPFPPDKPPLVPKAPINAVKDEKTDSPPT